jgi:nucleoside-diphosphate-sugar epimerase
LITGLGYIGIALATRLLEGGERVVGLESGFSTVPDALRRLARRPGMQLVRGSVSSARSIERAFADGDVTTVYHLAGQASAHPEAAPAAYTERTNLVGPRLVYEAAARFGTRRFVYGSSFKLYGDDLRGVVDESRPYGLVGDLAHVTKLYAEKLLEMLATQRDVAVSHVRLGIVYGLNRPMGFLHLDDAVDALAASAEAKQDEGARAYNAVAEVLTVGEVAGLVRQAAEARGLPVRVDGAIEPPAERYRVSSALARSGFVAVRVMRDSVPAVLNYYSKLEGEQR